MKKIFALSWLLLLSEQLIAQPQYPVYSWEEAQQASPDTVYAISFKKMKLDSLPAELMRFTRLRHLDLSFNRLKALPAWFSLFRELESLDLSKNKLTVFPQELLEAEHLRELSFNRNGIRVIPEGIIRLQALRSIDFWDNPVSAFPEAFAELPELREIHAEGIKYGPKFQERWLGRLPGCKIFFDPPCDCVEE